MTSHTGPYQLIHDEPTLVAQGALTGAPGAEEPPPTPPEPHAPQQPAGAPDVEAQTSSEEADAAARSSARLARNGSAQIAPEGADDPHLSAAEELLRNRPGPLNPRRYATKGFISNCCTFSIMLLGIFLKSLGHTLVARWVLAFGVFGFAGGITNWLAVHMLFDRIPGLYGSGVIPTRFREIREVVKDTMLRTFFEQDYLERYLRGKLSKLAGELDASALVSKALASPEVEGIIERQLEALKAKPEGLMLAMQGIEPISLKPVVLSFVRGAGDELGPLLLSTLEPQSILPIERLRHEIDLLMSAKLQELTPDRVKELMEEVIRVHLGWLIVWGNIFGGLIGLISIALGYP